jgi:rhodanese-related sulfurtransferase
MPRNSNENSLKLIASFYPVIKALLIIIVLAFMIGFVTNLVRTDSLLLYPKKEALESKFQDFERLDELLKRSGTVLLDARIQALYDLGRIPGAINIPPEALEDENMIKSLLSPYTKDTLIITYCSEPLCPLADNLATYLREKGFSKVLVFSPGFDGYFDAGLIPEE